MSPATGSRTVRHSGDVLTFTLHPVPRDFQARLRTNIGRAARIRDEIVRSHFQKVPLAGASWRDIPMQVTGDVARLQLPLCEVGYFKAKAFLIDPEGRQHWPGGPDVGISVHPSWTRSANLIYCAFPRMFSDWSRTQAAMADKHTSPAIRTLDAQGWTVIPPSGTLRSLIRELPHIFDRLGCRILHLLPVSPAPTTFARFGRFGSPYALQDLTAIDPSLVEFDRKTTGVDQFMELSRAVHAQGGRLMLDLVINHTGWGSREWNEHPEWFIRLSDGHFHSPGAWDVVWEDLVEFDQRHVPLWDYLARVFLTWCRRGVDAFRCDAGYKVPVHVWQFITARVRQEFPDTVFLLEGLGGPWETTHELLGEGGMQWAYSELFQNAGPHALGPYLEYANRSSHEHGTLVHYSETHDNSRLAARAAGPDGRLSDEGRRWSIHRNRTCALTAINGAFAFTNGVEWCATEQLNVHSSRGLHWGNPAHIIEELAQLNRLLSDHPAFFDGAHMRRVDPAGSSVVALLRTASDDHSACLVVLNADFEHPRSIVLPAALWASLGQPILDLAAPGAPAFTAARPVGSGIELALAPGAAHCLGTELEPRSRGSTYREARARADWALAALNACVKEPQLPAVPWRELAGQVDRDPAAFLASTVPHANGYPAVVRWRAADARRRTVVPSGHWLLVEHPEPFHARLTSGADAPWTVAESIPAAGLHIAAFPPQLDRAECLLHVEPRTAAGTPLEGHILQMGLERQIPPGPDKPTFHGPLVLLTNGRGGMSRMGVDLGRITSKYDCLLGANLHPRVPVDRHIFAKRIRAWINADGFISPLNADNLVNFQPGPPAHWRFVANAGDGRSVEIHLVGDLLEGRNTIALQFTRPSVHPSVGQPLHPDAHVRLTVRVDLEDRSYHWETKRNGGADHHFSNSTRSLANRTGFEFVPAPDRALRAWCANSTYHSQPEWSEHLPHFVEATRGMTGEGDGWSPGWFDIPIQAGDSATLVLCADPTPPSHADLDSFIADRQKRNAHALERADFDINDPLGRQLAIAAQAFVVRRDDSRTVIAGYPWFLDWGRDSLIAARGLIAAGMLSEVRDLLVTFARFEKDGTLPNSIHGEDASNRDTSDAPLWFGIVCEELAARMQPGDANLYAQRVDSRGRSVLDVLRSIACGYLAGTPNGIRVDPASSLVWSPSHFTWMDTNHPAGTPREGYPVEIQALWIRLLRQLDRHQAAPAESHASWSELARKAQASLDSRFWLEDHGWFADVLLARPGVPASEAERCDALRSNALLPIALGLITGSHARRVVEAARRHLVIPGALRSLAPLPVSPPLAIHAASGHLLNDPKNPYWPQYQGDEDSRRKPAYHNGTAWTWTFPTFCEALCAAYPGSETARRAAQDYLASMSEMLNTGCLGQIPEVVDGDFPHTHRGCDAQAWGITEALRVWKDLQKS
jgi:starch synthase (maltosyl-transferring)